jgi:SRSO17 transposase
MLKGNKKNLVFNTPRYVTKCRWRIIKDYSQRGFGVVAPEELEVWLKL